MHRITRYALIAAGSLCVLIGCIGVFVPVLPTTPFLLLAAALYARSSQRFYTWLITRRLLGEYIRAYREGRGMSARAKMLTLSVLWIALGASALFGPDAAHVRLALLVIGVAVTVHVLMIPTFGRLTLIDRACTWLRRQHYVLPLGSKAALDAQRVGGKAASLTWLQRNGFPVPPGFVIEPTALRAHLAALGCDLHAFENGDTLPHDLEQRARSALLPPRITRALLRRYRAMGGLVAVRSSATCEDSAQASCAGLLCTELGVQGDAELLAAVQRCWSSLFRPSVRSYLSERAVASPSPTMGVVVQRLVSALVSGVAFTADPSSGARQLIIEAAAGLGDGLVGGRITPTRYVIGPLGTVLQAPPAGRDLLPEVVLAELSQLLWRVDECAGSPQDIEWAWDGRVIQLLQCRPITTLRDKAVYSARMVAEMSPGIIKPLVWSVNTSRIAEIWDRAFVALTGRHDPDCHKLMVLVRSRLYVNADVFAAMLGRLGMPPSIIRTILFGRTSARHRGIPVPSHLLRRLPRTARFMRRITRAGPEIEAYIAEHDRQLQPLRDANLAGHGPNELLECEDALTRSHADSQWYTKIAALNLMIRSAYLRRLVRACAPDLDPGGLLVGLSGVRSVESGNRLRALSQESARLAESERRLLLEGSDADIRARLAQSEAGRVVLAGMDAFMSDYGFLNSNGTDFTRAPWVEQPAMIWRAIARGAECGDTAPQYDAKQIRTQTQERLLQGRGPVMRRVLRRALDNTRHCIALKERCSLLMSEDSYHMHRIATRLAEHLVDAGAIAAADEVFCLTIDEIRQVLCGELAAEQANTSARERREQLEADALVEPPEVIYGEWRPALRAAPGAEQQQLRGIGASPGDAHGRARVVLDPAAMPPDVCADDILVVPFTDAGWMPLFSGIGGIVTEAGGQLSHSAIIAREFGLPAVLSVRLATRLIRDGQQIHIDGTLGLVQLA
ncbi:MAG: DUF454 family protein [Chloroflexi bacterium]|nr:DUF454 family protein [Chloroflexota bacterium]